MTLVDTVFAEAMSRFASGVTIVTALDQGAKAHGYTATAFSSVSMEPPLILTCLSMYAVCHPVFAATRKFCVSILADSHQSHALHFASKQEDKFREHAFAERFAGIPTVDGALATLGCRVHETVAAGDHLILIGLVEHVSLGEGEPLLYFERNFRNLQGPAVRA
jgi:flavin reductase ActVB